MHLATSTPPALPFPSPLAEGDRWVFAFEQEGGAVVYRQAVIAQVRAEREIVLYIGPKRYPVPWTEVPAAFAHAARGTLRGGRFISADTPPPSASQSFPRLPPPELDAPPLPPPVVAPPVAVAAEPALLPEAPPATPAAAVPPPSAPTPRGRRRG